ncbi:DinB family protein [Kitasatospora sp. NBC_01300]|uniref:DinB family protein n=1 Tax=Kitasatospora sp. NBC_01300 TaxID=2903574 RepID=UPI00352D26EB|nr:DinB family protein [Kitasatospora sp. NBC_01300]
MGPTLDGRPLPPPHADERAMLEGWLEFHRATLVQKVAGLDDQQVRLAAVPPSTMTLLGLVQHLAEVERTWYQRVLAGREAPPLYGADGEGGYALTPERGMPEALADWRAEVEQGRELAAGASLEDTGRLSERAAAVFGSETVSLRWILVHLIEEYARHNGHADLLRESIDGLTGV